MFNVNAFPSCCAGAVITQIPTKERKWGNTKPDGTLYTDDDVVEALTKIVSTAPRKYGFYAITINQLQLNDFGEAIKKAGFKLVARDIKNPVHQDRKEGVYVYIYDTMETPKQMAKKNFRKTIRGLRSTNPNNLE